MQPTREAQTQSLRSATVLQIYRSSTLLSPTSSTNKASAQRRIHDMKRSQAQTLGTSGATFLRYFCLQTYFFAYILRITYISNFTFEKFYCLLTLVHGKRPQSRQTAALTFHETLSRVARVARLFYPPHFPTKRPFRTFSISSFTALRDIRAFCFTRDRVVFPVWKILMRCRGSGHRANMFKHFSFEHLSKYLSPFISQDVRIDDWCWIQWWYNWMTESEAVWRGLPESTCTLNFQLTIFPSESISDYLYLFASWTYQIAYILTNQN